MESPNNPEAERYVLGACMISTTAVDEVLELLEVEDFYEPRHTKIYGAIRRLRDQEAPTDVVSVTDALLADGEAIGNLDAGYMHTLTSEVPTAANAGYWAQIVKDLATRRHLIDAAHRAMTVAQDASVDAADVMELARDSFDKVADKTMGAVESVGEWFSQFTDELTQKPSYTPTPWFDLNQMIFGIRDGGMYVIGARPAQGKTLVGLQIATHMARKRPVLFVSLEMNRIDIAARILAAKAQIFIGALNRHQLNDADWQAVARHRAEIEQLPLVIADSSEVSTIPQLKAKVRAMRSRYKEYPVVVVDYLGLLKLGAKAESRQIEVQDMSRALKLAALKWNVPIVVLSQLNRSGTNRKGKAAEPQLSDLRESGAIEQDADVVLLLHRVAQVGKPDDLKMIIAKSRQSQTGEVTLVWQGQFARALDKRAAQETVFT